MQTIREREIRVQRFLQLKQDQKPIVVVTAYDAPTARAAQTAGVDAILVGDSLGMVALGFDSTIPVTVDMMTHHAAAVRRGAPAAFVIVDLPFMEYKISPERALEATMRIMQGSGANAVKLEGGVEMAPTIKRIVDAGVPVMAHIGLLPQSVHAQGGYRVQGRTEERARQLLVDAQAVEQAGAFSVVLEGMEAALGEAITTSLHIPTIGIGAGSECSGQVLVVTDIAGLGTGRTPKFAKVYANLGEGLTNAISEFSNDVRNGEFPAREHQY